MRVAVFVRLSAQRFLAQACRRLKAARYPRCRSRSLWAQARRRSHLRPFRRIALILRQLFPQARLRVGMRWQH